MRLPAKMDYIRAVIGLEGNRPLAILTVASAEIAWRKSSHSRKGRVGISARRISRHVGAVLRGGIGKGSRTIDQRALAKCRRQFLSERARTLSGGSDNSARYNDASVSICDVPGTSARWMQTVGPAALAIAGHASDASRTEDLPMPAFAAANAIDRAEYVSPTAL